MISTVLHWNSFIYFIFKNFFFRVIQVNTLEDRNVTDKLQWDHAVSFLEKAIKTKLDQTEANLREQVRILNSY